MSVDRVVVCCLVTWLSAVFGVVASIATGSWLAAVYALVASVNAAGWLISARTAASWRSLAEQTLAATTLLLRRNDESD